MSGMLCHADGLPSALHGVSAVQSGQCFISELHVMLHCALVPHADEQGTMQLVTS